MKTTTLWAKAYLVALPEVLKYSRPDSGVNCPLEPSEVQDLCTEHANSAIDAYLEATKGCTK